MELKQIEYFLSLAQMQNISQAADYLHISQPTLSKSLSNLERDLGVPLFDRIGNRLYLNASGQSFYNKARQAMRILDAATFSAKQAVYKITGNLSIVCLVFAPILSPCISEYMELNPQVDIQLRQYNHNLNLSANTDYDFILSDSHDVQANEPNTQIWVSQTLFSEDTRLIIGPGHPKYSQMADEETVVDLTLFSDDSFVTMQRDSNFIDYTYQICQQAGFSPKTYFHTDDFLVKMTIIREGLAIAFLPESCVEEALRLCPGLRVLQYAPGNIMRSVVMTRKKKSLLNEAALDFWDFLLEYYRLPKDERD